MKKRNLVSGHDYTWKESAVLLVLGLRPVGLGGLVQSQSFWTFYVVETQGMLPDTGYWLRCRHPVCGKRLKNENLKCTKFPENRYHIY